MKCAIALTGALMLAALSADPARAVELGGCLEARDSPGALRACTALIDASGLGDADKARALTRRGLAWLAEDEPSEAVADFSRALKIDPSDAEALTGRARARTVLGDHANAAEDWAAVITLDADAAVKETHMLGRAASLLAAGSKDAALEAYDKVIEANPKSIKAYIGRGNVYAAAGDRDKALAEFAAAEKIDPDDTAPHLARAEAAETWGDKQLAIENYLFVVKNNTRSAGPSRKALQRLGVDTPP